MDTIYVQTLNDVQGLVLMHSGRCQMIHQETSGNDLWIVVTICSTILLLVLLIILSVHIFFLSRASFIRKSRENDQRVRFAAQSAEADLTRAQKYLDLDLELKKHENELNMRKNEEPLKQKEKEEERLKVFENFCYNVLNDSLSVKEEVRDKCWEYLQNKYISE